ncbi:MAG: hypothetical protein HQ481_00600 [Alphaproteobacteria bacterium]|nr:hypothetical protein [Alphaproteobacteria bacterium]
MPAHVSLSPVFIGTWRVSGVNDVRQPPTPLDVDQPIELVGTRTSGPAPFFPSSLAGWMLELTFSCPSG